MLLLCLSFFPLIQDTSPPVVSVDIFNLSTSKFVTSLEFLELLYSSNITRLHGCCSFRIVVRMKRMMHTGDFLGAVGNTHIIIVFAQITLIMEVKPQMEVTL